MRDLVTRAIALLVTTACTTQSHDPAREDTLVTPAAHGVLANLELTISAHQTVDTPVSPLVQLAYPMRLGRERRCFEAPDDLHVTIDGHALQLTARGGPSRPSRISGLEIQDPIGCTTAMFRPPPGMQLDALPESTIVLALGDEQAVVTIAGLLPKRTIAILPSKTVRAGDRVTLHWTDDARWAGSDLSTAVSVYYPGELSHWIAREDLDVEPPRFSFVMPALRPGPALLDLKGELRQYARIVSCRGVKSCNASPNTFHDPIELVIAR